jgi:hypothetical protein
MYEARSPHPKISPEQTVRLLFSSLHLNEMTLFFHIQKKAFQQPLKFKIYFPIVDGAGQLKAVEQ